MSTVPTPVPEPTSPASSRPGPHPAVLTVLIVIAVLLALIAALLVVRDTSTSTTTAVATSPVVAGSPATESPQAPTPAAPPAAQPTAAASVTDEQVLALMHAEVRRDPEDAQAKGDVDAPVVLVLYSDFSCPYCTMFAQDVEPGLSDLVEDGTLRMEWRDLAQISASSPLAAQAGIAAANQGRFWELHDAVYAAADPKGHPEYTEESLLAFAEQAGVEDLERFRADMTSQETVDRVAEATQHAHQLGITGTPFLIVNDAVIGGYAPVEYVRQTVLDQAALVG
ncbi:MULTISPECIES: thioredoxin domain-containing protein [unclassified Actinomyces]|uniref:DsbA family protein n=1 Tax=unclassified Actinomyces TaxID=2609248 RepID=UPI002017C09A|nr:MULTISPECIES: thioredoxin domain-containing protein [unclassified Actinomyces]MCL3777315.1 thioredoxin domain-containing protein [Actinomyces sp. AC-20-1]MCL3790409.1 thioredoxin domain-containing protein [Actinomyces sp. 187325]MCL3792684.1 thioredoxin domain-containing protein [Actinomyces sp. 186855]MCL3795082.1 thioredoxin domain-containing protein [Actinomyces sp. 217892]